VPFLGFAFDLPIAILAGALADLTAPAPAIAAFAGASLLASAVLTRPLSRVMNPKVWIGSQHGSSATAKGLQTVRPAEDPG